MLILVLMVPLGGLVNGCTSTPGKPTPVDIASAYVISLCFFGCPLSVTVADEGTALSTPAEPVHLIPEVVRAANR